MSNDILVGARIRNQDVIQKKMSIQVSKTCWWHSNALYSCQKKGWDKHKKSFQFYKKIIVTLILLDFLQFKTQFFTFKDSNIFQTFYLYQTSFCCIPSWIRAGASDESRTWNLILIFPHFMRCTTKQSLFEIVEDEGDVRNVHSL